MSTWNGNRWNGREGFYLIVTLREEARTRAFCVYSAPAQVLSALFSIVRSMSPLPDTNTTLVFVQLAPNELSPPLVLWGTLGAKEKAQ